jgi:hypothetical protein
MSTHTISDADLTRLLQQRIGGDRHLVDQWVQQIVAPLPPMPVRPVTTPVELPRALNEQPRAPYAPITPIEQVNQSASDSHGLRPSQSAVAIERQHTGYPHPSQMITTFPLPNPPSKSATGSTQRFRNGGFQMATARGLQRKATVAQVKPILIGKTYNRVSQPATSKQDLLSLVNAC